MAFLKKKKLIKKNFRKKRANFDKILTIINNA